MKTQEKIKNARFQIITLLITSLLMISLFSMLLPVLPSSSLMRDSFWAHKVDAKAEYDVVCVGDSRVYRGIDPDVIETAKDHQIRCFNYGFSSAGLDSFLLARASRLLDPAGKKTLVVAVSANSFLPESLENEHLRSLLKWSHKDVWIKRNIYPHITCFDPYAVSDLYKMHKGEKYFEQYHLYTGFAASSKVPLDSGSALPAYEEQFRRQQFAMEAENGFIQYLEQLKDRGVKIIVVRVPTSHAMKMLEDKNVGSSLNQLKTELGKSGINWIEFSDNHYISYDGSHLTQESAEAFSLQMAEMFDF